MLLMSRREAADEGDTGHRSTAEHTLGVVAGIVGNGPKGPLRKMMRNAYRADRGAGVPHFARDRRVRGLPCWVSSNREGLKDSLLGRWPGRVWGGDAL